MKSAPEPCDLMPAPTSKVRMRISAALVLTGVSLAAFPGVARAAPTSTISAEADFKDAITEMEGRNARPLSFGVNPFMAIVAGAASANVEYLPIRHLGLSLSPRASMLMPAWAGEAGAHYWFGKHREASGFFLGPSAIYGRTRGAPIYGVALDGGVQTIFDNGITVGAGIGVQYVEGAVGNSALEVGPLETTATVRRAVLPRLLFSVGYSL
jgi:hypothetical protein